MRRVSSLPARLTRDEVAQHRLKGTLSHWRPKGMPGVFDDDSMQTAVAHRRALAESSSDLYHRG
jgi:hypothetical protein